MMSGKIKQQLYQRYSGNRSHLSRKSYYSITIIKLPRIFPPLQGGMKGVKNELLPFIIDLIFDGAYLRYIEGYCKKTDVEIVKRYLKLYQLMKGLEVIRRAVALKFDMNLLSRYFLEGFEQSHLFRKLVINEAWTSEKVLHEILVEAVKKFLLINYL